MKRLMITAACALAAGTIVAQDMSAPAPEESDTSDTIASQYEDDGQGVAMQAEAMAATIASEPEPEEFIRAEEVVENNLTKMKLAVGYDPERKAIIATGTAQALVRDPANDDDFMKLRSVKFTEAYLLAKAEVIRAISTDVSAMDRALTMSQTGSDPTQEAFAEHRAQLEEKRAAFAKKLAELDRAEADALRGVTMTDRFGAILEGLAKRLDEKFNTANIQESKNAIRDQLKVECAEMLAEYKALEAEAGKIPAVPSTEISSDIKLHSKMPLLGSSVLTQAESWDESDGTYEVSLALVWSPKLQENAVAICTGDVAPVSKKGDCTPKEWFNRQDLSSMIGPRRFVDNKGDNIFVGIAATDLSGQIKDRKAKKLMADTAAWKLVTFSLCGDLESYREASENYKEYDDDNRVSIQKLADVVSQKCDIKLQGCMPLTHKELKHPITNRKIYVTAYYLEPALAKSSMEILKKMYAGAVRQTKATQYRRGQHAGMEQALETQKRSKAEYNRGVADGVRGVNTEVQKQQQAAQQKPISRRATGSKRETGSLRSQGGAFSGDATIDTDF